MKKKMNEPLGEFEEIQLICGSSLSQEYTPPAPPPPNTQVHKYLRAMGYRIRHKVWSSRFLPSKIPGSQNLIYSKQKQSHTGAIFKGASWGPPLPVGQGHCEAIWISFRGSTMAPGDVLSMPSHGPA